MALATASQHAQSAHERAGSARRARHAASARPPLALVSGKDFAAHRLTMGIARTAVACAMRTHHYRVAALEHSSEPLEGRRADRWRRALTHCAAQRLHVLARQGFAYDDLPAPLRETFALYVEVTTGGDAPECA